MQTETNPMTSIKSPVTNFHNKRFTAPTKERLGKKKYPHKFVRTHVHTLAPSFNHRLYLYLPGDVGEGDVTEVLLNGGRGARGGDLVK